MLSRPPGVDKGEDDNTDVTLLPEPIFVRLADEPDPRWTSIEEQVQQEQQKQPQLMKEWCDRYQLEFIKSAMEPTIHLWKHEGKMVFPPNDELTALFKIMWKPQISCCAMCHFADLNF